ncbi:hypothetical protein DFH08DRAFT_677095 [Mycena albidolilacea]|uniref:AMP-dependent synthetase/ligase domain-containing protein n=1 Tax=Mycena albidolilacea TaxID=1033008 RepID=A0AAD7AT05_9AGAR|nr:hypothetical protein DFH08DRAFT_677095 [Mycena albidolilacea]
MASGPIPAPPRTQALSSPTFIPPPLDGTLTIAQLYDWHFHNSPRHRLFVYPLADGSTRTIFLSEAIRAAYVGSTILRQRFGWLPGTDSKPVVSILAPSETITYFILFLSCLRANYVVFPISPRLSAPAIANLIHNAGVKYLLVTPATSDLADAAIQTLKDQYADTVAPDLFPLPSFEDLFTPEKTVLPEDIPYEASGIDDVACLLHSSGSTSFPKLLSWSNRQCMQVALTPWFGERDLTNLVMCINLIPMYHGTGIAQIFWAASCGLVFSVFEPTSPPTVPTPENVFRGAQITGGDLVFGVPSFIDAWSQDSECLNWLATRTGVIFGGGPLNQKSGDYLCSKGITVFLAYGLTEGGIVSPVVPAHVDSDWNYFKFSKRISAEMVPYGDNTFELVVLPNPFCTPSVLNTNIRGISGYATSDLLEPHPTKPGYWKIFGRKDDQIIHSTGEKTNPGPLEDMLASDPHIMSAVIFGDKQTEPGLLVEPRSAFQLDTTDANQVAVYLDLIWPAVEKLNLFAPQQSRIRKQMVLVANKSKPFTYTAKMTIRRQAIIADYQEEIRELYATAETVPQRVPAGEDATVQALSS